MTKNGFFAALRMTFLIDSSTALGMTERQRTKDRDQRTEDRDQRTEDRGQGAEGQFRDSSPVARGSGMRDCFAALAMTKAR